MGGRRMMAADTVLQQYFTELQSEVKACMVNADLKSSAMELEAPLLNRVFG